MKLLLDTVALYRAVTAPESLPATCRALLADAANPVFVSMVSAWEIAIKSSLGRLALPCPVEPFFVQATRDLLAQPLGLDLPFVTKVSQLPHLHGDPFDRFIIAQALVEDCAVVTSDARFAGYGVPVLW